MTSSLVKATPSVPPVSRSFALQAVPIIEEGLLAHATSSEKVVGSGRFGSCAQMVYKGMFMFVLSVELKVCLHNR